MQSLHQIVENELEAPALAWKILAYYWGMSAFGLGPAYKEYMQSDQDKRFDDEANEALNTISGFNRRLTIKERFDRAANFYLYCYEQGNRTSINPPFDMPPLIADLIADRIRLEPRPTSPDQVVKASVDSLLADRPELQKIWAAGERQQRHERAVEYNARVLSTLEYVMAEIDSLRISPGYSKASPTGQRFNITAELMDLVMPEDVQDRKFGECRLSHNQELITSGIFGAYYNMGHNLELAMYDDDSKARLSSTHHAILHTWRQLYDIDKEENS